MPGARRNQGCWSCFVLWYGVCLVSPYDRLFCPPSPTPHAPTNPAHHPHLLSQPLLFWETQVTRATSTPKSLAQTALSQAILLEKSLRRPVSAAALRSVKDIAVYSLVTKWILVVWRGLYLRFVLQERKESQKMGCQTSPVEMMSFETWIFGFPKAFSSRHCLTAGHDSEHLPSGADGTNSGDHLLLLTIAWWNLCGVP